MFARRALATEPISIGCLRSSVATPPRLAPDSRRRASTCGTTSWYLVRVARTEGDIRRGVGSAMPHGGLVSHASDVHPLLPLPIDSQDGSYELGDGSRHRLELVCPWRVTSGPPTPPSLPRLWPLCVNVLVCCWVFRVSASVSATDEMRCHPFPAVRFQTSAPPRR